MGNQKDNKYWLGFDLGGTKMMAAVLDGKFRMLGMHRRKTRANRGAKAGMVRIFDTVDSALKQAGIVKGKLAGIGVGSPGPLDLNRGVILNTPNLGWGDVYLKDALEKHYGCPVVIANDVDAGTYGEYRFGAAKGARCVLGVFPGTGIGGACVYEGRIIRGKVHSCMEIGHMIVAPKGNLCGCGQRGCIESIASRLGIAAEAALAARRGHAPHLLAMAGTDVEQVKSTVIAKAIKAGDKAVEDIVRHAARQLGLAIANAINLLAPDVVVLGGGLVEELPEIFLDESSAEARKRAMPPLADSIKFVEAKLGGDACVMGAAALVAEERG